MKKKLPPSGPPKNFYVIDKLKKKKEKLKELKDREPSNHDNLTAVMGRFLHDRHIITTYFRRNRKPDLIGRMNKEMMKI